MQDVLEPDESPEATAEADLTQNPDWVPEEHSVGQERALLAPEGEEEDEDE